MSWASEPTCKILLLMWPLGPLLRSVAKATRAALSELWSIFLAHPNCAEPNVHPQYGPVLIAERHGECQAYGSTPNSYPPLRWSEGMHSDIPEKLASNKSRGSYFWQTRYIPPCHVDKRNESHSYQTIAKTSSDVSPDSLP